MMDDFQAQATQTLQLHQESQKGISIPNWALDLVDNDFHTAIFLKQAVFWSTKTSNPDGFYKSYKDWAEESRLSRYHVQQAVKVIHELAGCTLITITKKKVNGAPTLFYKLDWEALYQWICKSLTNGNATDSQMEMQNSSQMDLQESYKSLRADRDIHTDTIQTEIPDFFSSDPSPATSEPAAVEEKEKSIIPFPSLDIDPLVQKLADVVGVSLDISAPLARQMLVTLQGNIRDIQRIDPNVKPSDFADYLEYYQLQKPSRPRPTAGYVVMGWKGYKEWLSKLLEQTIGRYLPGIDDWLEFSRADWLWIDALKSGDCLSYTDKYGVEQDYIKQDDGTFIRKSALEEAS